MLTINVDSGIGMGAMQEAAKEMVRLANMLSVCVATQWNGVNILCVPGMPESALHVQYDVRIKAESR